MVASHNPPSNPVPEADRFEQEEPVDPRGGSDQQWPASPTPDVNEADQLEQAQQVLADPDEEYPPNPH